MPNLRFGTEYAAQRDVQQAQALGGVCATIPDLQKVLGPDGPERAYGPSLDQLRETGLRVSEVDRIMEAAGLDPAGKGMPDAAAVRKAGLVKFLRHLYLVDTRANHQVWVLSTPASSRQFPQDELLDAGLGHAMVRKVLGEIDEHLDADVRRKMGEASQLGLAWAEAAKRVLSAANGNARAMEKVRRWFAGPTTDAATLSTAIGELQSGFKKVASLMNESRVVVTDMPHTRGRADREFVEAFVKLGANRTMAETPRTIYIEQAFLHNFDVAILHDMKKNWARILLHECTHLEVKTHDHCYAIDGLGIEGHPFLTDSKALANADSWAFFAADCAGALTDNDIHRALWGTRPADNARPKKIAPNWS